jgi:DNA-binding transcriptional MerR regulator
VTFRPGQKLKSRVEAYAGPTSSVDELPPIPGKRYFTIGEVSELCDVKPHVLRYWEQEFPQLKPVKRRGNRRYYQRHDVVTVRQIRSLLYEQGFTIGGARQQLSGDTAKHDSSQSHQIIRQMRLELEDLLHDLKRRQH